MKDEKLKEEKTEGWKIVGREKMEEKKEEKKLKEIKKVKEGKTDGREKWRKEGMNQ